MVMHTLLKRVSQVISCKRLIITFEISSHYYHGFQHLGSENRYVKCMSTLRICRVNYSFELLLCHRCHVILHLSQCQERAVQCKVRGCNAIFKRKNEQDHIFHAASTHAVLQEGKVLRLRGLLYFKVR